MARGVKDAFNNSAKSMTALDLALERGHKDVAAYLVKQGAALNERGSQSPKQPSKSITVMRPLKLKRPKGQGGNE